MKLAICIPLSWDYAPAGFFTSFAALLRPRRLREIEDLGVTEHFILVNRAFPLDLNRNRLVAEALERGADYVLFLDADMTFPEDLVPRLLETARAAGAAIVSAAYFKKRPPHVCVSAVRADPDDPQLLSPIDIEDKTPRLVECDVVGMGAALIARKVFDDLEPPWFRYEVYRKTGETSVTEDVPLCRRAKQAGHAIVTDTGLVCKHLATVEIGIDQWLEHRPLVVGDCADDPPEEAL